MGGDMKKEDSFENLYKKVDATSKTRFHASRRLKSHAKLSTYIVVLISLGLILLSLMQAYNLGVQINSEIVPLVQVFSAIAVLVYSLLVEQNNYYSISEKMYSYASKLGVLKQKIYPHLDDVFNREIYDARAEEYHGILKEYETHSSNEFSADYYRAQLEMPENYKLGDNEKKNY